MCWTYNLFNYYRNISQKKTFIVTNILDIPFAISMTKAKENQLVFGSNNKINSNNFWDLMIYVTKCLEKKKFRM